MIFTAASPKPHQEEESTAQYFDHKNNNHKRGRSPPQTATPSSPEMTPNTPTLRKDDLTSIAIIDGTKKIRYGNEYWVQRNVVTIKITSQVPFDTVNIYCYKKGVNDPKLVDTIQFFEQQRSYGSYFESSVKRKLPMTSGRPETQKKIWLTAEFITDGQVIRSSSTDPFFVCSRPR
jgi:hypothetical protein